MSNTKRLTKELVHDAAKRLDADGKKPSAVNVRDALGFGSYSTIIKHLSEYTGEEIEGPDEIPEPPAETISSIWRLAYTAAWQITQGAVDDLTERLETAEETLDKLSEIIETREKELVDINTELAKTKNDNRALLTVEGELTGAVESLTARLAETAAERDRLFGIVQKHLNLDSEKASPKARPRSRKNPEPVKPEA
jgi:hypothetical protein